MRLDEEYQGEQMILLAKCGKRGFLTTSEERCGRVKDVKGSDT